MNDFIRDKVNLPKRDLPVLITIDVCDGAYEPGSRKSRFRELMNSLPDIRKHLKRLIKSGTKNNLPATWFVRADSQVSEVFGGAVGLYRGWMNFWDEVNAEGGEIAWHPHLYRRSKRGWIPIRDSKKLAIEAEKTWAEISSAGWRPTSCRIGESVSSNELMNFLDSAGLWADSTAVPGRSRSDGHRRFDWSSTPSKPYHPANGDYRRPPGSLGEGEKVDGELPLKLLEIPCTMAEIRAPYDSIDPSLPPPRRYVDLSFDPSRVRVGLERSIKNLPYLLTVLHPLQASGRNVPDGNLVMGGFDIVSENLKSILELIDGAGRTPRFMTVSGLREILMGKDIVDEKEVAVVAPAKSGDKYQRLKGGTERSSIEGEKKQRRSHTDSQAHLGSKGTRRPPRGPQKQRG